MSSRIVVDPIRCDAHGLCAELLPERISLDEWGFPLIDSEPLPASLEDLARRTVEACPTLALRLAAVQSAGRESRLGGREGRQPGRDGRAGRDPRSPARPDRPTYRVHRS